MPTIRRFNGMRVVIYPNDHRPAHVHVIGADGEAVFFLNCPDGPLELRECYGFSQAGIGAIKRALATALTMLCAEWRRIHEFD